MKTPQSNLKAFMAQSDKELKAILQIWKTFLEESVPVTKTIQRL
jgi:hypothetical protein